MKRLLLVLGLAFAVCSAWGAVSVDATKFVGLGTVTGGTISFTIPPQDNFLVVCIYSNGSYALGTTTTWNGVAGPSLVASSQSGYARSVAYFNYPATGTHNYVFTISTGVSEATSVGMFACSNASGVVDSIGSSIPVDYTTGTAGYNTHPGDLLVGFTCGGYATAVTNNLSVLDGAVYATGASYPMSVGHGYISAQGAYTAGFNAGSYSYSFIVHSGSTYAGTTYTSGSLVSSLSIGVGACAYQSLVVCIGQEAASSNISAMQWQTSGGNTNLAFTVGKSQGANATSDIYTIYNPPGSGTLYVSFSTPTTAVMAFTLFNYTTGSFLYATTAGGSAGTMSANCTYVPGDEVIDCEVVVGAVASPVYNQNNLIGAMTVGSGATLLTVDVTLEFTQASGGSNFTAPAATTYPMGWHSGTGALYALTAVDVQWNHNLIGGGGTGLLTGIGRK